MCLRKPQFPNSAENFATTIEGQQHAFHFLLNKTPYSLPTELPGVESRCSGDGEGLTPKK